LPSRDKLRNFSHSRSDWVQAHPTHFKFMISDGTSRSRLCCFLSASKTTKAFFSWIALIWERCESDVVNGGSQDHKKLST
jgi:hypothetical protein